MYICNILSWCNLVFIAEFLSIALRESDDELVFI